METLTKAISSYGAIFLAIVVTGAGVPVPEEIPVAVAGVLSARDDAEPVVVIAWPIMFAVCVLGVLAGDAVPYFAGRRWGPRVLDRGWARRVLPTAAQAQIRQRLISHGAKLMLTVRFIPGTRTPVFLMAGATGFPTRTFLFANGLAAIPYVALIFGLGFLLGDPVVAALESMEKYRTLVMIVIATATVVYLVLHVRRMREAASLAEGLNDGGDDRREVAHFSSSKSK